MTAQNQIKMSNNKMKINHPSQHKILINFGIANIISNFVNNNSFRNFLLCLILIFINMIKLSQSETTVAAYFFSISKLIIEVKFKSIINNKVASVEE